mmetsp:Transcript_23893/g.74701  ORF Transcript_23893/g.74701 Transcript_23893/m.74701 type:complete len:209 (-) Transcript_23893:1805-2431(-)
MAGRAQAVAWRCRCRARRGRGCWRRTRGGSTPTTSACRRPPRRPPHPPPRRPPRRAPHRVALQSAVPHRTLRAGRLRCSHPRSCRRARGRRRAVWLRTRLRRAPSRAVHRQAHGRPRDWPPPRRPAATGGSSPGSRAPAASPHKTRAPLRPTGRSRFASARPVARVRPRLRRRGRRPQGACRRVVADWYGRDSKAQPPCGPRRPRRAA